MKWSPLRKMTTMMRLNAVNRWLAHGAEPVVPAANPVLPT